MPFSLSLRIALVLCLAGTSVAARELRLPRQPAISPNGGHVAFTWGGDLWRVPTAGGEATRLTADPARDAQPIWSNDGRWIAFSSTRDGASNPDVYIMPAGGGAPRRLTWDAGYDAPLAFARDSRSLLLQSFREPGWPSSGKIYRVPIGGGREPVLVLEENVTDYVPLAGGAALVTRGGTSWWRRGYRGAASSELWAIGPDGTWAQLTTHRGRDRWPGVTRDGAWILWIAERDGTDQVWTMPRGGGAAKPITAFSGQGARHLSVAFDADVAVCARGDGLYRIDLQGRIGEVERIAITAQADVSAARTVRRTVSASTDVVPSPDGETIAFVAHGELYVRRLEDGIPVRLTDHPARDAQPAWAPDGRALFFTSDRAGGRDIFRVRAAAGEDPRLHRALRFVVEPVVASTSHEEHAPRPSPDGASLAFLRGAGDLCILDLGSPDAAPHVVLTGWDSPAFSYSPDGRWIAISRQDDDFNEDVWLVELETGQLTNVSQHPDTDRAPAWSPDGRKLAFVSKRHRDTLDIHLVYLRREDDEKHPEDWADEREDGPNGSRTGAATANGASSSAAAARSSATDAAGPDAGSGRLVVRIDTEEIWRRIRRVKPLLGDQGWVGFSADSDRLVFRSEHAGTSDLWSCRLDGGDLKRLTTGDEPRALTLDRKGKRIVFLKGGGVPSSVSEAGGKRKTLPFRVRIEHGVPAERRQVFVEAWRTMRDRWYDPTFKGRDWNAVRALYEDLAITRPTHREFQDVIHLMLGELNGSHLGVRGGGDGAPAPAQGSATGRLGVRLAPHEDGWVVRDVLPWGPCDREGSRLQVGDRITHISGERLGAEAVLAPLLDGSVDREVRLGIVRQGSGPSRGAANAESVIVRPITDAEARSLAYDRWTARRRRRVVERTGGRLGYVHVRSMSAPSLERFEAELYARAHGKSGLLIDVRNNGGGWTADYLLAVLSAPEHAWTVPRGGAPGYPQGRRPLAAWTKPVAVLCNERSFSNAEIFSHAMKTSGRGVLVGRETFGGVISTGARGMLDGSRLRVPFRGWYVLKTGADMHRGGAVPDIPVENTPGSEEDRQLDAAIDALMEQLAH
jgi:tricorn protease